MAKRTLKNTLVALVLALLLCFGAAGCSPASKQQTVAPAQDQASELTNASQGEEALSETVYLEEDVLESPDLASIPEFSGEPYVILNGNKPAFTDADYARECFEEYSPLDALGRCGVAYAHICFDIMPTEKRGDISKVHPTGWHSSKYDFVDGKSLYNRCHLIGYQLAGENANKLNLITGTRYMNVKGMLPFENGIADYVESTGNSILLRVTPIFEGNDLVARGVQMEAASAEDHGKSFSFNVFCYNVQPGVTIDYATGDNQPDGSR